MRKTPDTQLTSPQKTTRELTYHEPLRQSTGSPTPYTNRLNCPLNHRTGERTSKFGTGSSIQKLNTVSTIKLWVGRITTQKK